MQTANVPQSAARMTSSSSLLSQLTADTSEAIDKLAPKAGTEFDLAERIAKIEQDLEQAATVTDTTERISLTRIATATLESLRNDTALEENDFRTAAMGLTGMLQSMGADFVVLSEKSPEETTVITNAENRIKNAETALAQANALTGMKTWFRGKEKATTKATEELAAARNGLADAVSRADQMANERLMKADMQASMQAFQVMVERAIGLMKTRNATTAKQLNIVKTRKEAAFKVKEEAGKIFGEKEAEVNAAEADLQTEEALLGGFANGTPDFIAQEIKISDLKSKLEKLRGDRNVAQVVFLSKEKFASELQIHEVATRRIFDNQRTWIAKLTSDNEERQITFANRLETMKALQDLDVASAQSKVGDKFDLSNANYMATAGVVADKQLQSMIEGHPEQIRKLEAIRAEQMRLNSELREREAVSIAAFKDRWGIDPMATSMAAQQPVAQA